MAAPRSRRPSRARLRRGRRRVGRRRSATERGRRALRGFRGATLIAVALTSFLLLVADPSGEAQTGADAVPDTVAIIEPVSVDDLREAAEGDTGAADPEPAAAVEEAAGTLREIGAAFARFVPRLLIALLVFAAAALLVRLLRPLLRRALASFERADAYTALIAIAIWLTALGVAFGVIAGDVRALLGSLGLIGLALSWALQAPIESFTGWLLNSFRGYYRVGDRVAVGEVFGDVYGIDLLTTTVWEYGGPDRPPGSVRAEQPTGRLITFPNSEVLTGTVVNYTRDFPYVWDELTVSVTDESELRYAMEVLLRVADEAVGEQMRGPAHAYDAILKRAHLEQSIPDRPQVFASPADSWTDLTIRYLVGARERRRWKSELTVRLAEELARDEHRGRIVAGYPRQRVTLWEPPREAGREDAGSGEGGPGGG